MGQVDPEGPGARDLGGGRARLTVPAVADPARLAVPGDRVDPADGVTIERLTAGTIDDRALVVGGLVKAVGETAVDVTVALVTVEEETAGAMLAGESRLEEVGSHG